jgi:hypothetical protein
LTSRANACFAPRIGICRETHSSMLAKAAILTAKPSFAKTSTAKGGTTH